MGLGKRMLPGHDCTFVPHTAEVCTGHAPWDVCGWGMRAMTSLNCHLNLGPTGGCLPGGWVFGGGSSLFACNASGLYH